MERLKKVDKQSKYLVHGYIHKIESTHKLSMNIPSSIIRICILFFFQTEYFEKCGDDLMITGDKSDTLKRISTDDGYHNYVAYGLHWMDSTKYETVKWTVKVVQGSQ